MTHSKNALLQNTTKLIIHLFQGVLVRGVILEFLPFSLSLMVIRHLSMTNNMKVILF
jgi:sRNA-binding regulator protein Hfq